MLPVIAIASFVSFVLTSQVTMIKTHGVGTLANSLKLGCDCLGEIRYFDAFMTNSRGDVFTIENAVCMHEEDFGIPSKHVD